MYLAFTIYNAKFFVGLSIRRCCGFCKLAARFFLFIGFHGALDLPQQRDGNLLCGVADRPQGFGRIEPADPLQGIRGQNRLGVKAAASKRHILDTCRHGLKKQLGGLIRPHPGKAAALGGFHQVGKIHPAVVPRHFFGGVHQPGGQLAVRLHAKVCGKDAAHRVPVFRAELPEMHVLPAAPGLRISHVEHIFEAHAPAGLIQQDNAFRAALDPAFELVPDRDRGAGRGVRVLGVNEDLIVRAVFIHPRGGGKKRRPFFRICGNVPRCLFQQRGYLF